MQAKLIISFQRLSEADFQAKAGHIIAALTANPHYPEPWLPQVPSLSRLNDALNAYREAYHASLTRDTLKIKQRNAARQALVDLFGQLAPYLEMIAQGDTDILSSTGYDLRRDIQRGQNSGILPAPTGLRVSHGQRSGTLEVRVDRLTGAGSYEVQTAQGDPTVEANWKHTLTSTTSSRILLENLTPAQTYWVRVRGVGSGGNGVWAEAVSVIVV
ncbi:MAG: fibronectin type III domain-containing protein [Candidatus Methylumidiphilus sp.]